MLEIKNQELVVAILPKGSLLLEWAEVQDAVNKTGRLLQEEIYRRFNANPESWLLFLGFCDPQAALRVGIKIGDGIRG